MKPTVSLFILPNTGEITSIASAINQATLVPEGQPILGYIAEGEDVFDEFGYVDENLLLSVPPVDKAYVPYYGKKFLHFAYSPFFLLFKSLIEIHT